MTKDQAKQEYDRLSRACEDLERDLNLLRVEMLKARELYLSLETEEQWTTLA